MYHITTCTLLFWNPNISWNKALGLQVGRILAATAGSNTVTRTIDLPTPYTIVLLWLRKTVKSRNSFYFKIRMRSLFLLWIYIYQKVEYGPLSYLKTRITLFFSYSVFWRERGRARIERGTADIRSSTRSRPSPICRRAGDLTIVY